jgi:1,4-alpha-glucan branching enzyme
MIRKELSSRQGYVRVTFELPASLWASQVYLVGDFNDWKVGALPFQQTRKGVWSITLELPAHQAFEFRYLIDGRWCSECHADGYAVTGRSGANTANSIVVTTLPLECLEDDTGHGVVHEAASDRGMDFPSKRHK